MTFLSMKVVNIETILMCIRNVLSVRNIDINSTGVKLLPDPDQYQLHIYSDFLVNLLLFIIIDRYFFIIIYNLLYYVYYVFMVFLFFSTSWSRKKLPVLSS